MISHGMPETQVLIELSSGLILERQSKIGKLAPTVRNLKRVCGTFVTSTKSTGCRPTVLNGEKYYIGKNSKLTKVSQVEKEYNLPEVFGNFEVVEFFVSEVI